MKSNFLKMILPMAAIAVALTGAFSTNAMNTKSKTVALVQGYHFISQSNPCQAADMCETSGTSFCRVGGGVATPRLWAKDTNGNCVIPLYKP
ncbi:DUF6520 family protein [Flavobacterium terrae]|jgi:hypothetical protein|uniref:Uncharacterized protein n=1 Tax=Flavobacterium terrae TaxID=415425 RepID=A0A1M6H7Y9_9FLAO|nr:DUF6520 family protein [Flavobacterium terrae]SHJ18274.1 hypothetical protein SAMN05444363_2913 [Flavobacterium terrae]